MEAARTSMIVAAAPHFLWPFAVRYAAHQFNLWPRVTLLETSPTLRKTGKVGDASVFWVWGSRAFVCDTSVDKLSAGAIPCVFLGFTPDAPGWQFYHPTSRPPPPPPPLFLTPGPPPLDPHPPQAPAPSEGAGSGGAEPGGEEPGGAEPAGVEPGGAEPEGVESGGAEPQGAALSGGPASASPRLSPHGTGASRTGRVGGDGARDPTELGAAGAGGSGAGGAGT
ncbi:unnamed protein product [Closterium sp. NIES-53]